MWLATTPEERSVYLVLTSHAYTGWNNGKVPASIGYLVKMTGMGRTSIVRALEGLSEKGLIRRTLKGAVFRGKPTASTFEICEFGTVWNGKDYDVDPRLDWSTSQSPPAVRPKRSRKRAASTTQPENPCTGAGPQPGVPCTGTGLMACTGGRLMDHVPGRDSFIDFSVYNDGNDLSGDDSYESWRTDAIEPEEAKSSLLKSFELPSSQQQGKLSRDSKPAAIASSRYADEIAF